MKKYSILLLISVFFITLGCSAQQSPYTGDIQFWSNVQITYPLLKRKDEKGKSFDRIDVVVEGIARFGRNVTYPVDTRFSTTIDFIINKYFKISPGYLYQRAEIVPNIKNYESRATLAGHFEKKFRNFTFRHRSMFEYKFRNSRTDTQVYRSRFQLSHPFKYHEKELFSPFISEEPYYDFPLHKWNRNEFFAGISRKINRNLTTDFFYVSQTAIAGFPRRVNGFGISFKIRVD